MYSITYIEKRRFVKVVSHLFTTGSGVCTGIGVGLMIPLMYHHLKTLVLKGIFQNSSDRCL